MEEERRVLAVFRLRLMFAGCCWWPPNVLSNEKMFRRVLYSASSLLRCIMVAESDEHVVQQRKCVIIIAAFFMRCCWSSTRNNAPLQQLRRLHDDDSLQVLLFERWFRFHPMAFFKGLDSPTHSQPKTAHLYLSWIRQQQSPLSSCSQRSASCSNCNATLGKTKGILFCATAAKTSWKGTDWEYDKIRKEDVGYK